MSHEESETVQLPDGSWVNVYGRRTPDAGKRLPGALPFDDLEAAVAAARKRSHEFDPEMERAVYGIMADQAAGRMRGPLPSMRSEGRLGQYLRTPLPQANFDGQLGYDTTLPQAPKEFPSYREEAEDPFADRVIKLMRRMGLTGPANFIGRTLAAQPGPRFSNQGVVQTETNPLGDATTIERGVGFSNLPAEDRRPPNPREVGEGFFNPISGMAGILAGPKALNAPKHLQEIADFIPGGKPQQIWKEHGVAQGVEGLPRFEISDDSAYIRPEIWKILERGPNVQVLRKGEEILNHPKLFEAYPHMSRLDIALHRRPGQPSGRFSPKTGSLSVEADNPKDMLSVLLHELQHGVQRHEGFAPGGSSKMRLPYEGLDRLTPQELQDFLRDMSMIGVRSPNMRAYARMGGEVEARNVQARHMDPELRTFTPEFTEDVPRRWQLTDVPHNAMFDEASPLGDDFMKKYTDLMLQLGKAKSMGADQKTLAQLQIELGRLERRMTQAGRGRPPEEWDAVKDPGGMWSPLAPEAFSRHLMRELYPNNPAGPGGMELRNLLQEARRPAYAGPEILPWANRVSRGYLSKYAGTERDPIKDLMVPAHVRQINREAMNDWDRQNVERRLTELLRDTELRRGNMNTAARDRTNNQVREMQRQLREGQFVGIEPVLEDRPWSKIMDSVIRQMPFEEFLETVAKNRRSISKLPKDLVMEIAKLENAYRAGKFGGQEPVWYLRDPSWLRDFPTDFARRAGHVGATTRANVEPSDLPRYDFPRAFRETLERDTERMKAATKKQLEDVFKGTKTIKEYPEEGFRWVEVGKSEPLDKLPEGWYTSERGGRWYIHEPNGSVKVMNEGTVFASEEKAIEAAKFAIARDKGREALQKEGDLMGHCVGGYCDAVESGRSKIFSLRDKKGEPHVTVEVRPPDVRLTENSPDHFAKVMGGRWLEEYNEQIKGISDRRDNSSYLAWQRKVAQSPEYAEWVRTRPHDIVQIKGKQNRAPVKEYQKYVQDFIRQGKWGDVRELENTGLIDLQAAKDYAKRTYQATSVGSSKDPISGWARQEEAWNKLMEKGRFITKEEFEASKMNDDFPTQVYLRGR